MSNNVSFKDIFIKGAIIFNPVLVQLVGLCPVVAAATNLQNALGLSVVACLEFIAICVIASSFFKKIPRWVRVALYFVIGLLLITPALWYVEMKTFINLSMGMKIYIPLIAINSVVAVHCEQFAVKNDVKLAFYDAAAVGIGASVVMITVGALREILGNSTIGGIALDLPVAFKGMTLPFGCLILLGFMAAILKTFVSKKYPEYSQENVFKMKKTPEKKEGKAQEKEPEIIREETQKKSFDMNEMHEEIPAEEPDAEESEGKNSTSLTEEETPENIRIKTEAEIDEFFKSLGIDFYEKGDKQ